MLDPNMQKIIDTVSMVMEQRRKKQRPGMVSGAAERVRLGSPQISELDRRSTQENEQRIAELLTNLLMTQRTEERQDKLTAEQWERELGLNRMNANQQMNYLREQIQANKESAQAGREFQTSERLATQGWQEDIANKASKEATKSAWTKLLTSAGLGALTGGIGGVAGLIPGVGGGVGSLLGLVSGGNTMGSIVGQGIGQNNMSEWLKKYAELLNPGRQPIGSVYTGVVSPRMKYGNPL